MCPQNVPRLGFATVSHFRPCPRMSPDSPDRVVGMCPRMSPDVFPDVPRMSLDIPECAPRVLPGWILRQYHTLGPVPGCPRISRMGLQECVPGCPWMRPSSSVGFGFWLALLLESQSQICQVEQKFVVVLGSSIPCLAGQAFDCRALSSHPRPGSCWSVHIIIVSTFVSAYDHRQHDCQRILSSFFAPTPHFSAS